MRLQGMVLDDDGNRALFHVRGFRQIYLKVIDSFYDQFDVNVSQDKVL